MPEKAEKDGETHEASEVMAMAKVECDKCRFYVDCRDKWCLVNTSDGRRYCPIYGYYDSKTKEIYETKPVDRWCNW